MNNNINPKAQQALQELKDQLKYIAEVGKNPASILQSQMKELRPVLVGLSSQYPYQDQSGEINYHKHLYPAFKSLEIYWQEYYGRNICKVAGTEKILCKRLQQEIGFINAFLSVTVSTTNTIVLKLRSLTVCSSLRLSSQIRVWKAAVCCFRYCLDRKGELHVNRRALRQVHCL